MAKGRIRISCALGNWVVTLLTIALLPASVQAQRPRTQTELLIDLARDATVGRKELSEPELDSARVYLRAALKHDPKSLDALSILLELETLTGRESAVGPLLDAYAIADPGNDAVFSRWLERGPAGPQTRESLQGWLNGILGSSRSAEQRSQAGVRLAELAIERLDT